MEWFAENYKTFGTNLEFVTNRSQEGSQFCRGFGGIGGILRWKVDFSEIEMAEELDQVTTPSPRAHAPACPHARMPTYLQFPTPTASATRPSSPSICPRSAPPARA